MKQARVVKKPYPEQISDRLIEQLEQGTAPFQKPWEAGELVLPYNPTTEAEYKGSNSFWLTMQGHTDPRWMTYKQAQGVDAQVRKGETGTMIQYWKFSDSIARRDDNGKPVKDSAGKTVTNSVTLDRPKVFSASVFNAEQINGLPPLATQNSPEHEWQRHDRSEKLLIASGASIQNDQADRAFYRPLTDSIHLPDKGQFPAADNYYRVALHELGHWTGHPSRLDREMGGGFGSESYAKEELRAEISSLMVSAELGVGHDIGQHASYVNSWIKVLKDDPTEILRAARDADKIREYVMSYDKAHQSSADLHNDPDVLQKAERYAERFTNDHDKTRFMDAVQERLDYSANRTSEQTERVDTKEQSRGVELER